MWGIGVLIGLVVVAGLALDRRLDRHTALRLLAVPALSVVVAALTPVGPGLLLTPLEVSSNAAQFIQEWQPTQASAPFAAVTLIMLVLAMLPWMRGRSVRPWWQIALAGTAVVFTLVMLRTVAVGAIIATPLLAASLQEQRGRSPEPISRRGRSAWIGLVAAAALVAVPIAGAVAQHPSGWPEKLRPQLAALPAKSVVLNDFAIGGWLLWAEPALTPVIDLRSEIYSMEYIRDYRRAEEVRPGWEVFLRQTHPTYALLPEKAPLTVALRERRGWTTVGRDADYVLLKAPDRLPAPVP
jgi:hypothetical protein